MWITCVGFGCSVGWLWLLFLQGPLLAPLAHQWGVREEYLMLGFLAANTATYLGIAAMLRPCSLLAKRGLLRVVAGFLTVSTACFISLPSVASLHGISPLAAFGLAVAGAVGFGVLLTAWMEFFAAKDVGAAGLLFAGGTAVAGCVSLLPSLADPASSQLLTVCLPGVSVFILLRAEAVPNPREKQEPPRPFWRLLPVPLVILMFLFYAAGGFMYRIVLSAPSGNEGFNATTLGYSLVCLAAGMTVYRFPGLDLRLIHRPVLPLVALGFFLAALHGNHADVFAYFLLQAGFALFDIYTWLTIAYLAGNTSRPAAVSAWGLFCITGPMLAAGLSYVKLAGMATEPPGIIAAIIAAAAALVSVFVFHDRPETFAGWSNASPAAGGSLVRPPAATAPEEDCGKTELPVNRLECGITSQLTAREKEVLILLVKGRNSRFIAEALNISVNTVKFHTHNIYGKCGVKDRQELLSLFENATQC